MGIKERLYCLIRQMEDECGEMLTAHFPDGHTEAVAPDGAVRLLLSECKPERITGDRQGNGHLLDLLNCMLKRN